MASCPTDPEGSFVQAGVLSVDVVTAIVARPAAIVAESYVVEYELAAVRSWCQQLLPESFEHETVIPVSVGHFPLDFLHFLVFCCMGSFSLTARDAIS